MVVVQSSRNGRVGVLFFEDVFMQSNRVLDLIMVG